MDIDPSTDLPKARERALPLTEVLQQCEDVEVLIAESVRNLAAVDSAIKHDLETRAAPPRPKTPSEAAKRFKLTCKKHPQRCRLWLRR